MSNESENKEIKVEKSKSVVIKEIISAIIGAIISFAVTFGLISTDQETELRNRMSNINATATEVIETLQRGDIVTAIAKANKIVEDTKAVSSIASKGFEAVKDKSKEIKQIAEKANNDIKEATKK